MNLHKFQKKIERLNIKEIGVDEKYLDLKSMIKVSLKSSTIDETISISCDILAFHTLARCFNV